MILTTNPIITLSIGDTLSLSYNNSVQWYLNGKLIVAGGDWSILSSQSEHGVPTISSYLIKANFSVNDFGTYAVSLDDGISFITVQTVYAQDCIDSLIDQNLLTVLQTITVDNGYNTEIGTVERPRTIISINGRYPYTLVIQMEPQDVEQWAHLRNDKLNYLVWYLDGKGDSNETADGEFIFRLRNVAADISKALKIDVTRGGYAQNTNILKSGFGFFQVGDTFESGVYVLLEIDRILDPNDPYSLAT